MGTAQAPLLVTPASAPEPVSADPDDDDAPVWPWLVAGASVLAGTIALVVWLTLPAASSQPSFPMLR